VENEAPTFTAQEILKLASYLSTKMYKSEENFIPLSLSLSHPNFTWELV